MRKSRGFTLIEVLICVSLTGILLLPLLDMIQGVYHAYAKSLRLAELRLELDRVGYKARGLLASTPGFAIQADNHGATLAPGRELRWHDHTLSLVEKGQSQVLARNVHHFSLFRRDGVTTLTLGLHDPDFDRVERKRFMVEENGYAARL